MVVISSLKDNRKLEMVQDGLIKSTLFFSKGG
jgi:hypothetical protein